jgi:rhodanese-related sulfurtransferase
VTGTMSTTTSRVSRFDAAAPADAARHFARRLAFETDCSDVNHDLVTGATGFVVVDARSRDAYDAGHVPGAISLPHATIDAATTASLAHDAVVVTYCAGPHCNAATQAAGKLAALGFSVKEMLGGWDYWVRDGYDVARTGAK